MGERDDLDYAEGFFRALSVILMIVGAAFVAYGVAGLAGAL